MVELLDANKERVLGLKARINDLLLEQEAIGGELSEDRPKQKTKREASPKPRQTSEKCQESPALNAS